MSMQRCILIIVSLCRVCSCIPMSFYSVKIVIFLADVTKEKPSIRTTIAFTQTVVKETCGIAIQTNSKVSCDASSQISRSATHEIGSQTVITSTTHGNAQTYVASAQNKKTQTTVPNTQDEKSQTYIPSAQNENTQTDVAVEFQTTGIQSKHFY